MEVEKDIKNYLSFTFEDFLQDDYFVESTLNQTVESDLFWKNFQEENKEKLDDFHKAVRCIRYFNKNKLQKTVFYF